MEYAQGCEDAMVVALGFFDCLHIGHADLINTAKQTAFELQAKCAVFTFENDPYCFINKGESGQILTFEERLAKLNDLRVDYCIKAQFDESFSHMQPEEFLVRLSENKNLKAIVAGEDYTFGSKGKGNVDLLKEWCRKNNVILKIQPFSKDSEGKISSTRIKRLLSAGEIEKVNVLLGKPYIVTGEVKHGQQRGRNIGFATANIDYCKDKLKIKSGVYYTRILIDGVWLKSVTNVGEHPTFDDMTFNIESHILYYNNDLYGKKIMIRFFNRIRDIQKFNTKEELAEMISRNIDFALKCKQ